MYGGAIRRPPLQRELEPESVVARAAVAALAVVDGVTDGGPLRLGVEPPLIIVERFLIGRLVVNGEVEYSTPCPLDPADPLDLRSLARLGVRRLPWREAQDWRRAVADR